MTTIFEISTELDELQALLDSEEITPEQAQEAVDQYFAAEGSIKRKAAAWMAKIIEIEALARAQKENADRIADRAACNKKNAEWRRGVLAAVLDRHQIASVEEPEVPKFSVSNAGGKLPLIMDQFAEVPDKFTKIVPATIVPDTDKIREHLDSGIILPFAKLGERKRIIRISGGKKSTPEESK